MTQTPETNPDLEHLLGYLKRTRGFDFTAYKRPSLTRRIQKRMQTLAVPGFAEYTDYLEVHPDEFAHLFNTILINVTDFFRDAPAWEVVAQEIIPRILNLKQPGDLIRIWSAGCASGQEAYTIAMLLGEALTDDEFRRRVKIYATDVDEAALNEARQASYTPQQVSNVPASLLEKYFESANTHYNFKKELRRSLIFGRHDLFQDAPISKIDLLLCRNTLMYFNAEAQTRILSRFDFALNGGGFLFLGKAEMLLFHNSAFIPVDIKRRIFAKLPKGLPRDRRLLTTPELAEPPGLLPDDALQLREAALDLDPVAQIVTDVDGHLVLANAQARMLFGLSANVLGQRVQDLYLPAQPLELRLAIDQAALDRRALNLKEIEWGLAGTEKRYLDVTVMPLLDHEGGFLGLKLIFNDVTRYRRLQDEIQRNHQNLETVNDELHSSNEELETTNEELQSTNAELETANEELAQRGDELNHASSFLSSILASLPEGVVVIDRNLQVLAWNSRAEDLWGLRAQEVRGQHFFNLDIGLPVEQLKGVIRQCLAGETDSQKIVLAATNRRGKAIQVRVTCNRLAGLGTAQPGVIVVMDEIKDSEVNGVTGP